MRFTCWIIQAKIQTHIHNFYYSLICTTTMVTRTLLNVTLYVHCLSCLIHACKRVTQRCPTVFRLSVVTAMQTAVMRRCRWSRCFIFSRYNKFIRWAHKKKCKRHKSRELGGLSCDILLSIQWPGLLTLIIQAQALNNLIVTSKWDTQ